jgi:hypothetical protein
METPFKEPRYSGTNQLDLKEGKTNQDAIDYLLANGCTIQSQDEEKTVMIMGAGA